MLLYYDCIISNIFDRLQCSFLNLTKNDKRLKEEIGSVIEKETKGNELKRAMDVSKEAQEVQQAVEPVIFWIWDPPRLVPFYFILKPKFLCLLMCKKIASCHFANHIMIWTYIKSAPYLNLVHVVWDFRPWDVMTKVRYFLMLHFQFSGPWDANRVKIQVDQGLWQFSRSGSTSGVLKF